MDISRKTERLAAAGPAAWFEGDVSLTPLFPAQDPSRMSGNSVTFAAGARTHWHTHPLGQIILITDGICYAQKDGSPVEVLHPGDVARFAPDEKHWHGAGPHAPMTHIAIQEAVDGVAVTWLEAVSEPDTST